MVSVNPTAAPAATVARVAAVAGGQGSWNVVGNSGSIAIHFILFTNNQALVMQRPDLTNPNPFLLVRESGRRLLVQLVLERADWLVQFSQVAGGQHEISAVYNAQANTFVPFHITESPFCSGGSAADVRS